MRIRGILLLVLIVASALGLSLVLSYPRGQDVTFYSYLSGVIAPLISSNKLIRVNLYNHDITLYEGTTIVKQAKIAATGNPRNSTATPTGNFRILSKEKRHISSLSGVIMPLSLRFNGPYYFHDIPLHKDGTVINTQYSNGCIRLPGDLAQELFQWADIGTRVQIFNVEFAKTADAPMVYLLTPNGYRRPIATLAAFESRGYQWKDVFILPAQELAVLPLGAIIQ